jgi:hypothetical protein
MMHRFAVAAAAMALVACTSKETKTADSAAATAAAAPATPNVVTFTAKDFAFEAPDTIPAGVTTIRLVNQGPSLHHAQLLKFEEGKTLADFAAAMKAMKPTDAPPTWVTTVGGPNPPAPGAEASVTQTLQPGSYAVVCFVDIPDKVPHIMKGMAHAFVVTPSTSTAVEPTADVTLALADYSFTPTPALTAGHHVIRVDNTAQQPHEVFIAKLDSGKTLKDVANWAGTYKGKMPATPLGGLAAIMPGSHGFVTLDLAPGDYIMMCFVMDAKDGKPHFMHGMATQIKIS